MPLFFKVIVRFTLGPLLLYNSVVTRFTGPLVPDFTRFWRFTGLVAPDFKTCVRLTGFGPLDSNLFYRKFARFTLLGPLNLYFFIFFLHFSGPSVLDFPSFVFLCDFSLVPSVKNIQNGTTIFKRYQKRHLYILGRQVDPESSRIQNLNLWCPF